MDPKLAEVYQTNQPDESDVEALATAALAEKLAEADEVNVDGLSDDEAEALASQILDGDSGSADAQDEGEPEAEAAAEEPAAEGEEKTAGEEGEQLTPEQEKIAEADYLGRVMAHAYVAERKEIEKEAAAKSKTASKVDNLKGAVAMTGSALSKKKDALKAGAKGAANKVGKFLENHPKTTTGLAVGGLTAAGVGSEYGKMKVQAKMNKKEMDKKSSAEQPAETEQPMSALDQLALARAHEILKEHGIDPSAEQPAEEPEQEKKSSIDEEKAALLAQKVEERAQAMLTEAGYIKTEEPAAEGETQEEQK